MKNVTITTFLLSTTLRNYINFTNEEILILQKVAQVRYFKKKQVVLEFGEKEQYISCVAKGLVRKHIMSGDKSITTEFAAEGGVICSNSSLGNQVPSAYSIQALEPTTLICFTLDAMNFLYGKSAVFFEFGKIIVSNSFLKSEEREIMLMKYNATQRLENFIETKPDLLHRLPQNIIASYLNIQPETFSKLKRQFALKEAENI
jgi:CRP-like cAMP-binding protein